jgi:outer membrane lipoprotein SlyB
VRPGLILQLDRVRKIRNLKHENRNKFKVRVWNSLRHRQLKIILITSLATVFLACSEPLTTTEKSAGIGTVAGASLGAIIGSVTGHAGAGAGIGAAVGLVGGALIGDQIEAHRKQEQAIQEQMATQQAEIDRAEQQIQQLKQQDAR